MKARLSPTTAKDALTPYQLKAARQLTADLFKKRERVFTRRMLLALCLALNDLYGFGDKRLSYTLNGMCDIIEDYAAQSFTPTEARDGELEDPALDPMAIAMERELASRKQLHIQIGDFVK